MFLKSGNNLGKNVRLCLDLISELDRRGHSEINANQRGVKLTGVLDAFLFHTVL